MQWTLLITMSLYTMGLLQSLFGFCRKRQTFISVAQAMVGCGFASHTRHNPTHREVYVDAIKRIFGL